MLIEDAKGLFHRAIPQSGHALCPGFTADKETVVKTHKEVLEKMGMSTVFIKSVMGQYVKVKIKVLGLSLHPGKPVLLTVHITPWPLSLFIPSPSHSTLYCCSLAHSDMIVHCPTSLFTSMVWSDRPDYNLSGQCVVRDKPQTPFHIDCQAQRTNPRSSVQHSTDSPP